jgi:hypothetical protein
MPSDRNDPNDFLGMAQRMLRELFGSAPDDEDPWSAATREADESSTRERHHEPSAAKQRENLTFALATRAVEALEDLALNVAAIRQRLERSSPAPSEGPATAPEHRPTVEQPPGNPDPGAF